MDRNTHPTQKSWLVHGPQGCGKTTHARAIADAMGLKHVFDGWEPGMRAPATDHLVLTNAEPPFDPFVRRVLTFDQALARADTTITLCRECRVTRAVDNGTRLCVDHQFMSDTYERYDALKAEGHQDFQAAVMAGLADPDF
ncbi:AAA family ATPase [Pseudomonas sp. BN515]|uniref:AAA family ATPase n=1 Tax=Pseudomonas sp. BN515 TaxID=2567892 RepID=UPI0024542FC7|nr:AAA family ATPase [Pseudomonas sp. BN515]MDH4873042.1 AAA family ATPase [Pseudomonas sp. BN515]